MVATPIGNLEDITFRAIRVLKDVSTIAAEDTRRTGKLLRHYGIDTPTRSFHEHNEHTQTPGLLERLKEGVSIALVSDAGTPLLSDPGRRLVRAALERGFQVQAVPGASAVLAALVCSGLADAQFTFVGFPPSRSNARKKWLIDLRDERRPVVLFEAPHRITRCLRDMLEVLGDRRVAVCRELTKLHETLVVGPISDVVTRVLPKGELTIVIAPADDTGQPLGASRPPIELLALTKEFGELTENARSRRDAIRQLAGRHGVSMRTIYDLLERQKSR